MDDHESAKEEAIALYLACVKNDGLTAAQAKKLPMRMFRMLAVREADGKYWLSRAARKKFRVVMTGGVFDVIHPGHLLTLSAAKKLGDVLIVAVATDARVKKAKGRAPMHPAKSRADMVASLRQVDLALVGVSRWQDTLARVGPDAVVFGYDQKVMPLPDEIMGIQLSEKDERPNAKTGKVREKLGL